MLPKFPIATNTQYHTVDDMSSKDASRCSTTEDTTDSLSEDRNESTSDIFTATGKQFSVLSAETDARESEEGEVGSPRSPADCCGFPDVEFNEWPQSAVDATMSSPSKRDTAADTVIDDKDTAFFNSALETSGWLLSSQPPPPPPSKPPIPTLASSPTVRRGKQAWEKQKINRSVNQTAATEMTSLDTTDGAGFFVGCSPNATKIDASFAGPVANVTMDAFGFPLVEPTLPNTPGARSVKAMPVCPRDSPARLMRSSKSDPALNRLLAHAQMLAYYKEPDALEPEAISPVGSRDEGAPTREPNQVASKSFNEPMPIERKLDAAIELLTKAQLIVTDDYVDKMLNHIQDPRSPDVTSTDATNPVMNKTSTLILPKTVRASSPESAVMEGSFEVQESSIEVMESSFEIPMRYEKPRSRKRQSSRFRCTDNNVYCNINLAEVERAMWALVDAFDETAGKCGYVVGCIDRVPKVVKTSHNDTFSLLEDESLLNKLAAEHSVSLLDSLTIDD